MKRTLLPALLLLMPAAPADCGKKTPANTASPLDEYIRAADQRGLGGGAAASAPGSLWSGGARFSDLARDPRASQVDDLITVVVSDKASAIAKGGTTTSRKSSVKHSVASIFGPTRVGGALSDLANATGESQLQGQGETSRETVLTTTLSARVTRVLPNGYLVVEGTKDVSVNSERQMVTVRGVVRPADLNPANMVRSDRVAQLEVRVNGKGVVGDAIRRPFILYRILMGLLPF